MGWFTAKADRDKEMHRHLRQATAAIRNALAAVSDQARGQDQVSVHRARDASRRLRGALDLLEGIRNLHPGWNTPDPDLVPEDEKQVPVQVKVPAKPGPQPDMGPGEDGDL